MFKNLQLVYAVWFIIVGGIIIFIDGRGWCIACRDTLLTVVGVISLILGVVGLISRFSSGAAVARE
ncbi:MAG TPA: hypothetical protein VGC97_04145 [Pyrinomonadaceae bacterium]|jgi:hypothetical protein